MERKNAWKEYTAADSEALDTLAADYMEFISSCKTERECVSRAIQMAEDAGYVSLEKVRAEGTQLKPGARVYASNCGKALVLVQVGKQPMEQGMNILGAHVDSPRLDIKQNPLYESDDFALLDTHYYGGIKSYQWLTLPLAIHGVVVKKSGDVVKVSIGEDVTEPAFVITDLLPHLASKQMGQKASEFVDAENLDVLVGSRPMVTDEKKKDEDKTELEKIADKSPVKAMLLSALAEKYDIDEEDFLSAELEVVPAGPARECGFDRSMILGYGQDDRVCSYPSLLAQIQAPALDRTAVCVLVDKEEIGSVGATGMTSLFFENVIGEIMEAAGQGGYLALRRALAASHMLSSDVSAAYDPTYASVYEPKNAAYCGRGVVFNKFTGARGKSGSNDTNAEFIAKIRAIMDDAGVAFQFSEMGRVNAGGGGTIAYILAKYGMNVVDCGVAVLSMHAPWEVTSKADLYETMKCYEAFLAKA